MGLNHMNGRVEDAITGRFLSPDPYVNAPGNTQGWNRYSYVNNNPLTFVDPTGFENTTIPYECAGCSMETVEEIFVMGSRYKDTNAPPNRVNTTAPGADPAANNTHEVLNNRAKEGEKKDDALQEVVVTGKRVPRSTNTPQILLIPPIELQSAAGQPRSLSDRIVDELRKQLCDDGVQDFTKAAADKVGQVKDGASVVLGGAAAGAQALSSDAEFGQALAEVSSLLREAAEKIATVGEAALGYSMTMDLYHLQGGEFVYDFIDNQVYNNLGKIAIAATPESGPGGVYVAGSAMGAYAAFGGSRGLLRPIICGKK
jgi:hypothetical protein